MTDPPRTAPDGSPPTKSEHSLPKPARDCWGRMVVVLLLGIHAGLLAWGAYRHSPTYDEVAYLPAGVSHWVFGRFDLASVSPPLVRLVAAAPVVLARPKTEWRYYEPSPSTRPAHRVGRDFARVNGERTFWLYTLARWACVPFSLIGGYVCFAWARALYGAASGLLACGLWCFSPNILAHGQLVTPDMGTTALAVAAAFTFWRWLRHATWQRALVAGLVLGLAQLTKSTLVIFFALWPVLWVADRLLQRSLSDSRNRRRECLQLAAILVAALYVLNLGYGFQGSGKRLGDYTFVSRTLSGNPSGDAGNRFARWGLGGLPLPLPENYLRGIDFQKKQLENRGGGQRSYLRGQWQDHGWWYYYLYALAIKVPLGTWILAGVAGAMAWREARGTANRPVNGGDTLVLLSPLFAILALVSAQTGFNHHMRYVLPIFPFAFVAISRVATAFRSGEVKTATVVAVALLWSVGSSLSVSPHSLSYFNELVGGPEGGPAHLIDSNVDWGQDLLSLREWLVQHPEAAPMSIAYFGNLPVETTGLTGPLPPGGGPTQAGETDFAVPFDEDKTPGERGPQPGWYAVSVNYIRGVTRGIGRDLRYFQEFTPVARAGYSILIYHISPEQAANVGRRRCHRAISNP